MKHIVLAVTVAAAGLIGLVTANASAQEPDACSAALFAKNPNLAKLKKVLLKDTKKLPKGITATEAGVKFDVEQWTLGDAGDGVVSFEAKKGGKKKKKKKKKGGKKPTPTSPKYMTCLCNGSDGGGCHAFTNMETGDVHCEDTGCGGGCGIAIFGDAPDLAATGFELP